MRREASPTVALKMIDIARLDFASVEPCLLAHMLEEERPTDTIGEPSQIMAQSYPFRAAPAAVHESDTASEAPQINCSRKPSRAAAND
ncbi:hypothetical protein SxD43FB_10920 [Sphingobium sp. D43FB]|nr:hypothetical protein SxD43FB_10920 [Sphingobium sp. D43FB]